MGNLKKFVIWVVSCCLCLCSTHQLRTYEAQVLLQLRKHLEYPLQLQLMENYNGDLCDMSSTEHFSISCQGDSVSELKIIGNKPAKVTAFHGFAVPNKTLSESFLIESFVTTLTRLSSLRVLTLVSLGIWGPLPDKIHRLEKLEVLDLSSNYMFGSVPFQMSRLVKLRALSLDENYFNDTVPDWLDSLADLSILSLKNNSFKGQFPSSIAKITTLTDVVLSQNAISGKLPDLSELSGLHLLDLRDNHFDSELPSLPEALTTILLSNNSFSGRIPAEVKILNQLQELDLSNNLLTGTPPSQLFSLPNIRYLNLASNKLTGSFPDQLSCANELGFVDISDNNFVGDLPSCFKDTSEKRSVKFDGNCFSLNNGHQHPVSYCKEAFTRDKSSTSKKIALLVGVIGGISIVVVFLVVVSFIFIRRHRSRNATDHLPLAKMVQDNPSSGLSSEILANARIISEAAKLGTHGEPVHRVFFVAELHEASNGFDKSALLGEGSIGKVYKGRLTNGSSVAIRLLTLYRKYSIQNLRLRLDLLSKLRHSNLVGLLGYCIDGGGEDDATINRVFLVYEFVPNGNFRSHLSDTSPNKVFKWSDRLAVLISVAKAVHFLHTGVIPASYNNRLKTNNILLDEHRIAKLSDYGMSIITEELEKLEGKPEGPKSWHLKKKEDDVYNFGFILLESLVGPIVSGKGESFLLNEMTSFGSQDGRRKIVDPIVLTTCSQESLSIVISITNKCISPEASNRPSFEDVLWNLQYAAQVQATADADQKSDAASQTREN
ncbi:transmembrane signal receptor [Lithospermum erythrorhizon]|uniref:Transmembrane signal receptor n=1 Tax=Lithospermum erythrorhizon TaxID=34254 RepID=A0AAV3QZY1_LITER